MMQRDMGKRTLFFIAMSCIILIFSPCYHGKVIAKNNDIRREEPMIRFYKSQGPGYPAALQIVVAPSSSQDHHVNDVAPSMLFQQREPEVSLLQESLPTREDIFDVLRKALPQDAILPSAESIDLLLQKAFFQELQQQPQQPSGSGATLVFNPYAAQLQRQGDDTSSSSFHNKDPSLSLNLESAANLAQIKHNLLSVVSEDPNKRDDFLDVEFTEPVEDLHRKQAALWEDFKRQEKEAAGTKVASSSSSSSKLSPPQAIKPKTHPFVVPTTPLLSSSSSDQQQQQQNFSSSHSNHSIKEKIRKVKGQVRAVEKLRSCLQLDVEDATLIFHGCNSNNNNHHHHHENESSSSSRQAHHRHENARSSVATRTLSTT